MCMCSVCIVCDINHIIYSEIFKPAESYSVVFILFSFSTCLLLTFIGVFMKQVQQIFQFFCSFISSRDMIS